MTGNYMGSPHTNHNYPQNPNNNARKGGGGQGNSSPTGDKLSLTIEQGQHGSNFLGGPLKGGVQNGNSALANVKTARGLGGVIPTTRVMGATPIFRA